MCDHGCACDNLLQKVPSIHCTAQAQTNKSCITVVWQMKDELKCALVECGWQSTAVDGITMMQSLCADSWDIITNVGDTRVIPLVIHTLLLIQ